MNDDENLSDWLGSLAWTGKHQDQDDTVSLPPGRSSAKAGTPELVPPGWNQKTALAEIFEALSYVYPDALIELRDTTINDYSRLWDKAKISDTIGRDQSIFLEGLLEYRKAEEIARSNRSRIDHRRVAILESLRTWAKRFHLTCNDKPPECVLQFALRTLERWAADPTSQAHTEIPLDLAPVGWAGMYEKPPSEERARALRLEPLRRKRRKLYYWLDDVQRPAAKESWTPTRAAHFEWFALYQCADWSSTEIAARYQTSHRKDVKPDSVLDAITDVANMAGLTLKKGSRGRERTMNQVRP